MDNEPIIPLDLATIDQLMDEIQSRFDDCVILGRKLVDPEERAYAYRRGHKGEYESVFFMMDHAKYQLNKQYDETDRDPEPWEEL